MSDTPQSHGPVRYDVVGAVATITLNRPEAMNAFDAGMKESLLAALQQARDDAAVRAVLLTGSGRAFSVGQDLREHAALMAAGDPAPLRTVGEHYNPIVRTLAAMPKPVVAGINGTAAGAGLSLALACDFRLVAEGTRFTTAFAGIGLTADSGISWTLQRLVGAGRATALLLLAEPFTAEQALEMGMVNAVVAADVLPSAALELATRLAAGPTVAFGCIKEAVAFAATSSLSDALDKEDETQTRAGRTQDHADAVRSFLTKSAPVFHGR